MDSIIRYLLLLMLIVATVINNHHKRSIRHLKVEIDSLQSNQKTLMRKIDSLQTVIKFKDSLYHDHLSKCAFISNDEIYSWNGTTIKLRHYQ